MSPEQIKWAMDHDWFISNNGDGSITVLESWSDGREYIRTFSDFAALKLWAGY